MRWWQPCETIGRWRAKTPNPLHLNFLELRFLDRLCLVLQESEMGNIRPVFATRYTPN